MKPRREKEIAQERHYRMNRPTILTNSVAPKAKHPEWPSEWLNEPLKSCSASRRRKVEIYFPQESPLRVATNVHTVPELWQEWEDGTDGGPPLGERCLKGIRWADQAARQVFDRRKAVLNAIISTPDHSEAVTQLETIRSKNCWSLPQLCKELEAERAGRSANSK